jgi:hypothetical protein
MSDCQVVDGVENFNLCFMRRDVVLQLCWPIMSDSPCFFFYYNPS